MMRDAVAYLAGWQALGPQPPPPDLPFGLLAALPDGWRVDCRVPARAPLIAARSPSRAIRMGMRPNPDVGICAEVPGGAGAALPAAGAALAVAIPAARAPLSPMPSASMDAHNARLMFIATTPRTGYPKWQA
jgi:hypothetical protein